MTASATAYPGRPRRRWVWVSVALVTAVVLVVPVAFRIALKAEIQHQIVPLTLIQQPVSQIQVDAPGQSVTILPGPPGEVKVMSDVSWLLGKPTIQHAWHGGILQIQASCPSFNVFADCQVDLVITAPAGVAIRAAVGSGRVAVARMAGDVRAVATSGSIRLTDVRGPIRVSAASGSIAASGLTSPQVVAVVASGQLVLGFAAPPEAMAISVGSGVAAVTVPPDSRYLVSSQSGPGSLTVAPGLAQERAAGVITVVVDSGRVRIGYPLSAPPAAAGS